MPLLKRLFAFSQANLKGHGILADPVISCTLILIQ